MDPCLINDGSWTDEKHMHFLDFLESSFLHAMFGAGGGGEYSQFAGVRLDRELPDCCESTRDSGSQTRKKTAHLSKGVNKPKKSIRSTTSKQHLDASNDQVVPQLEKMRRDRGMMMCKRKRDHHHRHRHHQQQTKDVGPK